MRIDELGIAEPCAMDWEAMSPEGRARFCSACGKHVFELARFTEREAAKVLADPAACVRAVAVDEEIVFAAERRRRRRFGRLALLAGAALLSAPAMAGTSGAPAGIVERVLAWWDARDAAPAAPDPREATAAALANALEADLRQRPVVRALMGVPPPVRPVTPSPTTPSVRSATP